MKYSVFFLVVVASLQVQSCGKDRNAPFFNLNKNVIKNERKIIHLKNEFLKNEIVFPGSLVLPLPVCSNNSSVILYDYKESLVKHFQESGKVISFNPLGTESSRLGGGVFKDIGFAAKNKDSILLVGSEKNIRKYYPNRNAFGNDVDRFEDCRSFNNFLSEIIQLNFGNKTVTISQNGIPCINAPRNGKPFALDEFKAIRFIRSISDRNTEPVYSFPIPPDNEIITNEKLYVKTAPIFTRNNTSGLFYAVINPTSYLYELNLDSVSLEFNVINSWELDLPYADNVVDYTLNKGIDRKKTSIALRHNVQFEILKAIKNSVVISYKPSFPIEPGRTDEAKYSHHNFLAIIDLNKRILRTFYLDYQKLVFLNCLDNGNLWFYKLEDSEQSDEICTIVGVISIEQLLDIGEFEE